MKTNSERDVRVRVAELISQQYKARGIKRGEFAKALGVTDRTVGYWVAGESIPKAELQHRIEEMFGWPRGAIAGAIAAGLSGVPVEDIRIMPSTAAAGSVLGEVPASDLAGELLGRLRSAEDQLKVLRRDLDEARRQLAQPDYTLAAHTVEDSMSERWAAEARFSDGLERPDG